jgi:hypothetical protein
MKTRRLLLLLVGCLILTSSIAQTINKDDRKMQSTKYRRSSIYTIMIDDAGLVKADTIKSSFMSAPIPDKFNDQTLSIRSFSPKDYPLTAAEQLQKNNLGKSLGKGILSDLSGGLVDTTGVKDLPLIIQNFFKANKIPQQLVGKWFNRDANGNFNMDLVADRGQYDATEMQASIAKATVRGTSLLADAGEELIGNTFVVVSRFKYVKKEEVMKAAKRGLGMLEKYGGQYGQMIAKVGNVAADVASKGYVIQTSTYLYKLSWNDSISNIFYQNYWMDASNNSPERKSAFDTTSLFKLELVGLDKAWADLQSTIFTKKSEEDLIRIATIKAVDAVIAKLQKKHDVFKTKTPLFTVDPLTAKIGLKEGLEKGDKFEVLEQTIDDNGRTKYVRKGVVKVGDQIWDNRYMAAEEQKADSTSNKPIIDRTIFKGGEKFYPGLLLRQIK